MGGRPTIVELMRAVQRPGWRWDLFLRALRHDELGLMLRPSELAKFDVEDEMQMEMTLLGYELQAQEARPKRPRRR